LEINLQMNKNIFDKLLSGYKDFRIKYATDDYSLMSELSEKGQSPKIMMIACCDSRVDPAVLLQCDPGDIFMIRNVANIVPPYEIDDKHHGTSAALEFAVKFLKIEHLIIMGHSQCGGILALMNQLNEKTDFIHQWVELIKNHACEFESPDVYAMKALSISYDHCLTFPWIKDRIDDGSLKIHRWFFDIHQSKILRFHEISKEFVDLNDI
jgi:carbonic anhydrase